MACTCTGIGGATAGQKVDNVKVVDIAGELGNDVGCHYEDHVGKGNVGELLHHVGTVDTGSFILFGRDILQNAGDLHNGIGNTDPQVNNNDGHSCPGGIGEEGQVLLGGDKAQVLQKCVDTSVVLEHAADDHQRYELGNRDGEGQDGAPQTLAAGSGAVDDHCHDGTGKKVQEGCKEGPDQCPAQNRHKMLADLGIAIKEVDKVIQTHPVKEHQMVINTGVVGESHQDHIDQRDNCKNQKADEGGRHQQFVDVFVQQGLQIILKSRNRLSLMLEVHCHIAAADTGTPDHDKRNGQGDGDNAVQQNELRVIALGININTLVGIPNFTGRGIAQTGQHQQAMNAAESHISDICNFNDQKDQTLNSLTGHKVTETHDQTGQPGHFASVFQCAAQRGRIGLLLASSCGLCQFFR